MSAGYIGKDGLDISTKFISKTLLTDSNVWTGLHTFSQISTACQTVSSSTTITDIPNNIIITIGSLTLTFPITMPSGLILNIRRTTAGTTTFAEITIKTIANATITSSTALIITLISYNNIWYMQI